ncbi:MAG TPA: chloride channel protein [Rectinemataceae bacterium]|nr:chloride channel protein [Rectinemataceae bacterium]
MHKRDYAQSLSTLARGLSENSRAIVQTGITSLAAALSSVAFLLLTNLLFKVTFMTFAGHSRLFFVIASLVTVLATSTAVGLLLNVFSPEAAGSGIPQVKAAYWKELGYLPIKPAIIKFVAGVLSIGGGTSLGREGPTVQIGASISSWLSGFMGSSKRQRRGPVVVGASAGLAAAFNTPLASITFVLEEIMGDMSSRNIGRVVLSSVLGAFTVYALVGRQPAFSLPAIDQVSWLHYLIVPIVALGASVLGMVFHRTILSIRGRLKAETRLPRWTLPVIGGFTTWVIGITIFLTTGKLGIFGLGYQDLSNVLHNNFIWWVAGIMIAAKLVATIVSYSFGGCGGIFSPLLFIGGFAGYFIGGLIGLWLPLTPSDRIVLSAVGMSACLGTVVRAPLSSLLIVFEMTHQFSMVPGLLLGMLVSVIVSRAAGHINFYDDLLIQDGHELHKIHPPLDLQSWQNLEIGAIANPRPVMLTSLEPGELHKLLDRFPYACFPVHMDGEIRGVATREEMRAALREGRPPKLQQTAVCSPEQTVHDVGDLFLKSPAGVIVIAESGTVKGIITLHDLLRAQASFLE